MSNPHLVLNLANLEAVGLRLQLVSDQLQVGPDWQWLKEVVVRHYVLDDFEVRSKWSTNVEKFLHAHSKIPAAVLQLMQDFK
jgi:hypothetical protein